MQWSRTDWIAVASVVLSVSLPPPAVCGEEVPPALDTARRQPIVDGRAAAGIRIGDPEGTVLAVLGGRPARVEDLLAGRRDLVYVAASAAEGWTFTLRVTLAEGSEGVQAVHLLMSRSPAGPPAYLGATRRGYRPGQPPDVLRAIYGAPEAMVQPPGRSRPAWWYREAGLVVVPDEEPVGDRLETRVVVVEPHLAAGEVARLAGGH